MVTNSLSGVHPYSPLRSHPFERISTYFRHQLPQIINSCHGKDLFSNNSYSPRRNLILHNRKIYEDATVLPILIASFIELNRVSVEYNSFNNNFCTHIYGVAIGFSLSQVLAGLWMCHLETDFLPTIHPCPSLWLCQMHDIFALWLHDPQPQ